MGERTNGVKGKKKGKRAHRWISLATYDVIIFIFSAFLVLVVYPGNERFEAEQLLLQTALAGVCIFGCRYIGDVYKQVWRYGSSTAYLRLFISDAAAGVLYYPLQRILPIKSVEFISAFALLSFNLIISFGFRLIYLYVYQYVNRHCKLSGPFWRIIGFFARLDLTSSSENNAVNPKERINIAIVGAGRVGAILADELRMEERSRYNPCCFIDKDVAKIGRDVSGIQVLLPEEATPARLAELSVKEIIFALPKASVEQKKRLFEYYKSTGCKLKVYDYLVMENPEIGRKRIREFDVEDLLFRPPVEFDSEETGAYYSGKVVMITGGGGSIGSELCRQIAKMDPRKLIILDVYENGAYDICHELRIAYGDRLDVCVEIVSVCDMSGMDRIFSVQRPDIVVHAAAHKHVPLMEHNCCEAVKNNVFGTLNVIELCEKYNVRRFMMVSTDKAVNPTNVMGATKRFCEMMVLSRSAADSPTIYSATRFGNVLGSAGSVIPLFKKQIMNGGPITLTDKRIIRYFMTIPEASQLVLQSGAMAKNGELFVLDMGEPVKILDLAENMVRLCGFEPYRDIDIIETGLRPGEKLYEELLIKKEVLTKTENNLIFIERDEPYSTNDIESKLDILRSAVATEDDEAVKEALMSVVPTFHKPEEVNSSLKNLQENKVVSCADAEPATK